ncbi:hypothetical protein BG000_001050 [Podila horticola]|nr:hypothetical protein BG000_001050 [Podila horticola]
MITPSRPMGYDPSGRISRLGTVSTDEGLGSEPPDYDQSFEGIAQYNEFEEGPSSVQRREEPEGDSTRREGLPYPHTPNYPYPATVQERLLAMWRSGEPPSSSSTPMPIPPPFLTGTRAMPTSNYSQDNSFEASTDSALPGSGPGPRLSGVTRTTGASTIDRSYPNPFLAQGAEPRIPSNMRTRQLMEEERRDLYRDEDIGMELDQLTAPSSFLRRRKSIASDIDDDYGGSVLHKEARLDPSSFKTSGEHEELRRETSVQLTTPDELERRTWMYEDSGRIGKVQRLGLWQH